MLSGIFAKEYPRKIPGAEVEGFKFYYDQALRLTDIIMYNNKLTAICVLAAVLIQDLFQSASAAGMTANNLGVVSLCFIGCGDDHLMRYGIRKKHHQIRLSQAILHIAFHLGENLRATAIILTDLLVLTDHTVMTAHNHNTHILPPALQP